MANKLKEWAALFGEISGGVSREGVTFKADGLAVIIVIVLLLVAKPVFSLVVQQL